MTFRIIICNLQWSRVECELHRIRRVGPICNCRAGKENSTCADMDGGHPVAGHHRRPPPPSSAGSRPLPHPRLAGEELGAATMARSFGWQYGGREGSGQCGAGRISELGAAQRGASFGRGGTARCELGAGRRKLKARRRGVSSGRRDEVRARGGTGLPPWQRWRWQGGWRRDDRRWGWWADGWRLGMISFFFFLFLDFLVDLSVGPSLPQQTMPHQHWEVGPTCQFLC
jgi:hypothetical protein